ncbi:MAG: protein tyrosine phosphatase [Deltaproteobacteria bacterium]|nr:protein tyrosine phosphatase [Deltaproteobacteria bacterium]
MLERFDAALARFVDNAHRRPELFSVNRSKLYSLAEKQELLTTWSELFAYFSSIEQIRRRYINFLILSPDDPRFAWGFLLTHAALASELAHGLVFADIILDNRQIETLFDERNDELGLPLNSFAAFKLQTIHVATTSQFYAGMMWMKIAHKELQKQQAFTSDIVTRLWDTATVNTEVAGNSLKQKGIKLYTGNALDILKEQTAKVVFPMQKSFATWAGDTRVARDGQPLIQQKLREALIKKLRPGDIIVTRQNWFLSNIGLPGFWPHAELYIGTPADLKAYFDSDPEFKAWLEIQPEDVRSFTDLLERRFNQKWSVYANGKDFQGHQPIRIIEAISEGVSFTATEHAFGVDYLGAMRPKLSRLAKAKAIIRAFAFVGRPYDFDFDFFSDNTLVCTELVYKSYQPTGLSIPLVNIAGRRTLPANEIVKFYANQATNKLHQLDFVAFIDGRENQGDAVFSDEISFRDSYKRPKWDIVQK